MPIRRDMGAKFLALAMFIKACAPTAHINTERSRKNPAMTGYLRVFNFDREAAAEFFDKYAKEVR